MSEGSQVSKVTLNVQKSKVSVGRYRDEHEIAVKMYKFVHFCAHILFLREAKKLKSQ